MTVLAELPSPSAQVEPGRACLLPLWHAPRPCGPAMGGKHVCVFDASKAWGR